MADGADALVKLAGLLGFGLGVANLVRSLWERSRDRRRTIEDDFWLQKVIYPQAIAPLMAALEDLGVWCAKTPDAPTSEACMPAWTKLQEQLVVADAKMRILVVIGQDLYDQLGSVRHRVEDAMAELVQKAQGSTSIPAEGEEEGEAISEDMTVSQLQSLIGELMRETVQSVIDAQRKI